MEDALQKLMKESASTKFSTIASAANKSLDLLESYSRAPAAEYRTNTLEAVRHALDIGNPKLVAQAIVILQKMVRDDRFHSKEPESEEGQWMSSQVLSAIHGTENLTEDQKQEVLKVVLTLSCHNGWILNGHLVVKVFSLCLDLYSRSGTGAKAAAQATCSQTVAEYCKDLYANRVESDSENQYNDSLPVFQFLTSKLDDIARKNVDPTGELALLLTCLSALISHIPTDIVKNKHFKRYVCTKLCPILLSFLDMADQSINKTGFFSKTRQSSGLVNITEYHVKIFTPAIMNLACLLGPDAEMRPVLESMFHRFLICSQPKYRIIALQHLKEVLIDPAKVVQLAVYDTITEESDFDSMPLFKLISDGIEECVQHEDNSKMLLEAANCIMALLTSLGSLSEGSGLSRIQAEHILSTFEALTDADYTGPNYYDGTTRLPKEYTRLLSTKDSSVDIDGSAAEDKDSSTVDAVDDEKNANSEQVLDNASNTSDSGEVAAEKMGEEELKFKTENDEMNSIENGSEVTEGPEEGFEEDPNALRLDAYVNNEENVEQGQLAFHKKDIPKTLVEEGDQDKIEQNYADNDEERDESERENARIFIQKLKQRLSHVINARGSVEMDFRLQKFASEFCHEYSTHSPNAKKDEKQKRVIILNADGVYMTCFYALHLNMLLATSGFYQSPTTSKVSRQEFMDNVLASGLLVYVSPVWLSEVFDLITEVDVFEFSVKSKDLKLNGLKNLLMDLDGFGKTHKGAQLLCDFKLFQQDSNLSLVKDESDQTLSDAGKRLARRILTTCWSSFLSHMITFVRPFLGNDNSENSKFTQIFRTSSKVVRKTKYLDERLALGIDSLHSSMMLCNTLEMHDHCGEMLEPLTSLLCPDPFSARKKMGASDHKYNVQHLVQIEDILKHGLELASQSQDCWKYVMRSQSTFALHPGFEVHDASKGIRETFEHYLKVKDKVTFLGTEEIALANSVLANRVEKLLDAAATKLNLKSLIGFMSELSFCSHKELLSIFPKKMVTTTKLKRQHQQQKPKSGVPDLSTNSILLFHRISEVMLKCVKSGRPLLHIVRAWSVVGPHLMEAACHNENIIAKKAVAYIHDIITIFLQNTSELSYFHFNETLFKPFEKLVCMELCDTDVQDQIVSCICEFVETSTSEIGSGWRSLFGTLKEVHFPLNDPNATHEFHWRAVMDVFEAFLATENPQIFANAALDFVQCLIHHVKGGEERQQLEELIIEDVDQYISNGSHDLTQASLQYLKQCNSIFKKMYCMSNCPIFQGAHRLRIAKTLSVVDPVVQDVDLKSFDVTTDTVPDFPYSYKCLQTNDKVNTSNEFLAEDESHGLLHVWYLLIDGLTSAVMNCPRDYQSQAVDTLFEILTTLQQLDEKEISEFGLFCSNHLLLPMLQVWLRRSQRTFQGWLSSGPNFKHCMGKTAEFVLNWFQIDGLADKAFFALKQLILILVECTVIPVESIARLGCSCLRHIILSGTLPHKEEHRNLLCLSLCRAMQLTLYPLHQLMAPFHQGSSNFYGDIGDVKVAARRDSCRKESHRLIQLAQQVLLLDQQRSELPAFPDNPDIEERSFLFLLQPPTISDTGIQQIPASPNSESIVRVPLRNILTGLTAHHILLQLYGTILLQGTNYVVPSLANMLLQSSVMPPLTPCVESQSFKLKTGLLDCLTSDQIHMLLCSLKSSYQSGLEFDSRPGLKFLVQKVTQIGNAANLYKQAGASWSIIAITLFELCVRRLQNSDVTAEDIKQELKVQQKNKNTSQFSSVQDNTVTKETAESNLIAGNTFFVDLHNLFVDICELYVDILVDKDKTRAKVDEMSKQQLYFLTIEVDDFHEMCKRPDPTGRLAERLKGRLSVDSAKVTSKSEESEDDEKESNDDRVDEEKLASSPKAEPDVEEEKESQTLKKPFQFSDFKQEPQRPESPNVSDDSEVRISRKSSLRDRLSSEVTDPDLMEENNDSIDEEVFRVTTQGEMNNMLSRYRHQKGKRTMPSSSSSKDTPPSSAGVLNSRQNPFLARPKQAQANESADPEIADQQIASLMADSDAQLSVWTELVLVLFNLASTLSDEHFKVFLPVMFSGVKALTQYAKNDLLKQQIADFFQRVASIYDFNPDV